MMRILAVIAAAVLSIAGAGGPAHAADLRLMSPGAMASSLNVLIPQFEAASGDKVNVVYSSAFALADRIKDGEAADVVILGDGHADALVKAGKLVAGSKVVVAKVGVGVFVRKGDPKPDISTVEAFDKAIVSAKIITYSDPALGGTASIYVNNLLDSLDVTGSIKPKIALSKKYKGLNDFVASGGADFGLNQITEVLADPRLDLVGPLPAPIQRYTLYAASVVATSTNQDAAKELISFLDSPASAAVMRSKGFESR